jgi:mono/diheme cytochrome c family protein
MQLINFSRKFISMKKLSYIIAISAILAACAPKESALAPEFGAMGMGSGMGARHHARVPEPYAGQVNPLPADEASLDRGGEIYVQNCATCHGDGGMGDGPGGTNLDPALAPIAHTSQMMADDYLFWRISEGGTPFGTAMVPYGNLLDEQARWDVINYVLALGSGRVQPRQMIGGDVYTPAILETQQAEMLERGVEQGVISPGEADTFERVHGALEVYLVANSPAESGVSMDERQTAALAALVDNGAISPEDAAEFQIVHERLEQSGLMP